MVMAMLQNKGLFYIFFDIFIKDEYHTSNTVEMIIEE